MPTTRREVLTGLLGVPLALAQACDRQEPTPIEGELLGANHRRGHRLRGNPRPVPLPSEDSVLWDAVIVGAGPAGLSAARQLRKRGIERIALVDLEDALGGTSRSGATAGFAHPWGAHYLPVPRQRPGTDALLAFLRELGAVDETNAAPEHLAIREPAERLFYHGTWYPGLYPRVGASSEDLAELHRFEAQMQSFAGRRDSSGRRYFAIPFSSTAPAEGDIADLDGVDAQSWLRAQGFQSPRLFWHCDYACRDDYGLRLAHTSAWALVFYFASRLNAGGDDAPLLAWPEGNGALVAGLAEQARLPADAVHLEHLVTGVTERGGEVHLQLNHRGDAKVLRARRAVLAVPDFVRRRLGFDTGRYPNGDPESFGAWTVAQLHLRDRPIEPGAPLCWDNVLYDSPSLGYIVSTHQGGRDTGPTVLSWYFALADADPARSRERLLEARFEDWRDLVISDLRRAHPDLEALTQRIDIWRWGHAMAQPRVGFLRRGQRREGWLPEGRVHFAHSDLSGFALFEEAFDHGHRAANEIADALALGNEAAPTVGTEA